jgi:hypothetical protein
VRILTELRIRGPYKELYGHFNSHKTGITELHVGKGVLSEACTPSWKLRVLRNWNYVYTDMETVCTLKLKLCVHWHGNCVYSEIETMCRLTWKLRVLRNWNYVYTDMETACTPKLKLCVHWHELQPQIFHSRCLISLFFPENWSHKIRHVLILHQYRSQSNSPLTNRIYQKYQVLKSFGDEPHEETCPIMCSFHTISAKSHLNQSYGGRDGTYSPVLTSNHRPAIPTDRFLCFPQFVWANVRTIPSK